MAQVYAEEVEDLDRAIDAYRNIVDIEVPYVLSFLATGSINGEVQGIHQLQERFEAQFGPGDYTGNEDAKEVFWDPNARSAVDGKSGAYVPLNGGKRYRLGQWSSGLGGIPVR